MKEPDPTKLRPTAGIEKTEDQEELSGTILVADDDDLVRGAIAAAVMLVDCESMEVENGEQVFAALESGEKFTVLVLDIDMPGMSGIEILKAIRANSKYEKQPVLVNSGRPSPEREAMVRKFKGVFIAKPYEVEDFKKALKEAIDVVKE